jgi:hypothetical protein
MNYKTLSTKEKSIQATSTQRIKTFLVIPVFAGMTAAIKLKKIAQSR